MPNRSSNHAHNLGQISLVGAGFFYALYSVFSRIIGPYFATFYQTWSRSLLVFGFFLAVGLVSHAYTPIKKQHRRWFAIVSLSAALTTAPYYIAILHMSLGTTMFVFYAVSLITSICLGTLYFKEKVTPVKLTAFGLGILGIVFLFIDSVKIYALIYILAAAFAGLMYSFSSVFSKKISSDYSNIHISTFNTAVILVVNLILSLLVHEVWYTNFISVSWLTNVAYAVATVCTIVLVIYGFKRTEAQIGSLLLLAELPFVILFGWLFYGEVPTLLTIVGGCLIVVAMALPNMRKPAPQLA